MTTYQQKFVASRVRGGASSLAKLYFAAKVTIAEWWASGGNDLVPNNSTVIDDGFAANGAPEITGAEVTNIVVRLIEFVEDMEANGNAKLNTVLAVANEVG